jgi:cytochrome oxidase Cu insertion factor (SCO1/SenC/PrrC family)
MMTTPAPYPSPQRNGVAMLVLVVALLALPFAIAGGLYLFGWQPARTANHGQLLDPPLPLPASGLLTPEGQPLASTDLGDKWLLLLSGEGPCDAACISRIDEMRRIQVSLNKDMGRLRRVVLSDQPNDPQINTLRQRQPDLLVAIVPPNWLPANNGSNGYRLHVVDPQGRLIMNYPAEVAAKAVRSDLERLLKFAWIG